MSFLYQLFDSELLDCAGLSQVFWIKVWITIIVIWFSYFFKGRSIQVSLVLGFWSRDQFSNLSLICENEAVLFLRVYTSEVYKKINCAYIYMTTEKLTLKKSIGQNASNNSFPIVFYLYT